MLDWWSLLVGIVLASLKGRRALVVENLLLRPHLSVAVRAHPPLRIRRRDRLCWVVARCRCADWRRHLVRVRPETVLRWHQQGWRRCWWWRSGRPGGRDEGDLVAELLEPPDVEAVDAVGSEAVQVVGAEDVDAQVFGHAWARPGRLHQPLLVE